MTKPEAAWLAIRIAGVGVGVMAVRGILALAYLIYILSQNLGSNQGDSVSEQMTLELALPGGVSTVLYAVVAFYLLFRGRLLHRLLVSECPGR